MKKVFLTAAAVTILTLILSAAACKSNTTTTNATSTVISPGNGAVINSDSVDTVKIVSISAQTIGYPWLLDVVIDSTSNVGTLPNPVATRVGNTVTLVTD